MASDIFTTYDIYLDLINCRYIKSQLLLVRVSFLGHIYMYMYAYTAASHSSTTRQHDKIGLRPGRALGAAGVEDACIILRPTVHLPDRLPVHPSIRLTVHPPAYPSVRPPVRPSNRCLVSNIICHILDSICVTAA